MCRKNYKDRLKKHTPHTHKTTITTRARARTQPFHHWCSCAEWRHAAGSRQYLLFVSASATRAVPSIMMDRKEGNVLFNDALNTFYLRLYGVGHMVKDHQIAREETRCRHMGYSFRLAARVLLYASSHRQDNTYHGLCYTSRGAPAGTRNSSMGPAHEGSIRRPIALPDDTMTPKVVDRHAVRGMTFPTTSKDTRATISTWLEKAETHLRTKQYVYCICIVLIFIVYNVKNHYRKHFVNQFCLYFLHTALGLVLSCLEGKKNK